MADQMLNYQVGRGNVLVSVSNDCQPFSTIYAAWLKQVDIYELETLKYLAVYMHYSFFNLSYPPLYANNFTPKFQKHTFDLQLIPLHYCR
jgi:hypothetical protein